MASLVEEVNKLTLKGDEGVQFAPKRKPGMMGEATEVVSNVSRITAATIPYYKYDIRMYVVYARAKKDGPTEEALKELTKQTRDDFPSQLRKSSCVAIYKYLIDKEKAFFGNSKASAYDRAACLYRDTKLKIGEETKEFVVPANVVPDLKEAAKIVVKIKQCSEKFQVSAADIQNVAATCHRDADRGYLEVSNAAASQFPFMANDVFVSYQTTHYLFDPSNFQFIRNNDLPALTDGKYLGVGATTSVKVLDGEAGEKCAPYVVTEVKKTAFHADHQSLIDKLSQLSLFGGRFSENDANRQRRQIKEQVKGIYVYNMVGKVGKQKKPFKIGDLVQQSARDYMLEVKGATNTRRISVASYFKEKYTVTLKYPGLFMVKDQHTAAVYPVEVLAVAPSQRVIKNQQTPEQIAVMVKASATAPAIRLQQTEGMKSALKLCDPNGTMAGMGMKVSPNLEKAPARVLPAPVIKYQGSTAQVQGGCKWRVDRNKFLRPMNLQRWMVVLQLAQRDQQRFGNLQSEYFSLLRKRAGDHGMAMAEPNVVHEPSPNAQNIKKWFQHAKDSKVQMIFFVTSDGIKLHDHIKLCEVEAQIVSQEVKLSKASATVEKRQIDTLDNVLFKMNEKLGGIACEPETRVKVNGADRDLLSGGRFIGGYEFSNPAPLSERELQSGETYLMPSVIGYSANSGKGRMQMLGGYRYVKPNDTSELWQSIREIIVLQLKTFKENTGIVPNELILYVHGISEGQHFMLASAFFDEVLRSCKTLSEKYQPTVRIIAVSRDHNERFYRPNLKTLSTAPVPAQNIAPGTVIDQKVVSHVKSEFYLNSHSAFQGTAKTAKYALIKESGTPITNDELQRLTHVLTFGFGIVGMAISVPCVVMCADRYAKRGNNNWKTHYMASSGATEDTMERKIEMAQQNLTYDGKVLSNVRFTA